MSGGTAPHNRPREAGNIPVRTGPMERSRKNEREMPREKVSTGRNILCLTAGIILFCLIVLAPAAADDENSVFTAYGDGSVEVHFYSNYFCPPCRALEPRAEPLLLDLVERNAIRLFIVDIPTDQKSLLYAHFFLYALKAENTLERALAIRAFLFEAATRQDMRTDDALAAFFEEHAVDYEAFDARSLYPSLNTFIMEDNVRATPTMVVIRQGESETVTGPRAILDALEALGDAALSGEEQSAE